MHLEKKIIKGKYPKALKKMAKEEMEEMKGCKGKALKKMKGDEKEYEMPKSKALSEHKRLVKVLKTKRGMKHEAKVQEKELKELKK